MWNFHREKYRVKRPARPGDFAFEESPPLRISLDTLGSVSDVTRGDVPGGRAPRGGRDRPGDGGRSRCLALRSRPRRLAPPASINGMSCFEGQLSTAGILQGIRQALIEHCIYERSSGQLLTGSFIPDYACRARTCSGR